MKLICKLTGAQVTASEEAAKRLIASGSFLAIEEPKPAPKKKTSKKEA